MKLDWKALLGIAVTVLLLWLVLRDVPFAEVWEQVRRGDMALLAAAVTVATAGFLVRAARWKVLLAPLRPETGFGSRFAAVSVGFMANNLLPARMGEFARAYAFSRVEPVSASAAFGTLVVERVLDGLTLLGILLFTVSWATFPASGILEGTAIGTAVDGVVAGIAVILAGMVLLLLRPRPFVRVAERVAARLPGDFARPIVDALEAFLDSLDILRRPWLLFQAVAWSIGFWIFNGLSFYLGMLAFGIRPSDPFVAALFTEAVVAFGVAVPSAPGFFGTFHWAADWALSDVYGVEPARALAFAFGYHLGGWFPITLIGLVYAWKLGLSMGDVQRSEERIEAAVEAEHPVAAHLLALERKSGEIVSVQSPEARAGAVEISAPAKVNLVLRVLGRDTETGFHDLETVFQAVDLRDELRIELARRGVELEVEGMDVGAVRENLVWLAAGAFAAETGLMTGLRIRLTKRIPAGAGLGGGSSDAAATLKALQALFGHPVPPDRLAEIASRLGSDVSFFLGPGPSALGRGRGDVLEPLDPLPARWAVVAVPDVHVSTAAAYRALDREREASTGPEVGRSALDIRSAGSWEELERIVVNDFEPVTYGHHAEIARLREVLAGTDARIVLLSGSGSAVFAVYRDREPAEAARGLIHADGGSARGYVVRTLTSWPEPVLEPGGRA